MADADCTLCPELLVRLGAAAGGLRSLAEWIEAEQIQPTLPWRELLPILATRARNLADQAEGRY